MEGECGICYEMLVGGYDEFNKKLDTAAMNGCGHLFHTHCLKSTFKKLESVGGQDQYDIPLPSYRTYSNHPECPKCRMQAPACHGGRCLQLHDHYFNGLEYRYGCSPYTTLFLDDDEREQVKAKQSPKPFVVGLDKATQETYDLAKTAFGLGIELADLQKEILDHQTTVKGNGKQSEAKGLQAWSKSQKSQEQMAIFLAQVKSRHCEQIAKKYMSEADAQFAWLKQQTDQAKTIESMQQQLDRDRGLAEANLVDSMVALRTLLGTEKKVEIDALNDTIKDLKAKKLQAEKDLKPLQTEITKLKRAATTMQKKLTKAETAAEGKKESDAAVKRLTQEIEKVKKEMTKISEDELTERIQEPVKTKARRRLGTTKVDEESPKGLLKPDQSLDASTSSAMAQDEPDNAEATKKGTTRTGRPVRAAANVASSVSKNSNTSTRNMRSSAMAKRKRNDDSDDDDDEDYYTRKPAATRRSTGNRKKRLVSVEGGGDSSGDDSYQAVH